MTKRQYKIIELFFQRNLPINEICKRLSIKVGYARRIIEDYRTNKYG